MIRCVRLWTGDDRNSHFEEGVIELEPGQRGDVLSGRTAAASIAFEETADELGQNVRSLGFDLEKLIAKNKIAVDYVHIERSEIADGAHEHGLPVHLHLLVRHGIYNLENLDLEALARDKVREFAFIFAPLRLKGATGSPGNPIAVR